MKYKVLFSIDRVAYVEASTAEEAKQMIENGEEGDFVEMTIHSVEEDEFSSFRTKRKTGPLIIKMSEGPKVRLEYLRGELRAERISTGELIELESLVEHIDSGDVELLEAAGVPEKLGTEEILMRPLEMAVCKGDGTWYDGVMIEIPADTPEDKVEEVAVAIVAAHPCLHEEHVAKIWVYNSMEDDCPEGV